MTRPVRLLVTTLCADKGGDIEFRSILLGLFESELSVADLAAKRGRRLDECAHGTSLVGWRTVDSETRWTSFPRWRHPFTMRCAFREDGPGVGAIVKHPGARRDVMQRSPGTGPAGRGGWVFWATSRFLGTHPCSGALRAAQRRCRVALTVASSGRATAPQRPLASPLTTGQQRPRPSPARTRDSGEAPPTRPARMATPEVL